MAITSREHILLDKANSEEIEIAFSLLKDNFNNSAFLSSKNYLRTSTTKVLNIQFGKKARKRRKFLSKNSAEYIAASALQHNIDSWNYFGHAINSLLRGDDQTSRHLFYYSELRSAMSFMATQGVGIFNDKHITITRGPKAILINEIVHGAAPLFKRNENRQSTHTFTWEAFDYFTKNQSKLVEIFDGYLVEGISINLWLEKFGINPSTRNSIAKDFLKKLSFDLDHFSKDREARNEVSYRPSCMENIPSFNHRENLKVIEEIWEFSKPNNIKGEIQFDLILLAEILQLSFKKTHPNEFSHLRAKKQFRSKLTIMLNDIGLSESRKYDLLNFFCIDRKNLYSSLSITDISSPLFLRGMLYRGFIFARLSNVFCNKLLKSSPTIDKTSLEFWWGPLGIYSGLWEEMGEPEDFADLWKDLEDLKPILSEIIKTEPQKSTKEFWRTNSEIGFILSTCSRIGFWGLGI